MLTLQEPLDVECYKHGLCGYVWKITVNPRIERAKSVVTGKTPSRESVPQSSLSWHEGVKLELTSHQYEGNKVGSL